MNELNEHDASMIVDALVDKGYIILESFLPDTLVSNLLTHAKNLGESAYKKAQIGRGQAQHQNDTIRTDTTCWLDGNDASERDYLASMESLRSYLNRYLYLGLFDYECHFAHYQKGDFYKKHIDALRGNSNRIVTTVFYLNPSWQEGDGGELLLYNEEGTEVIETVAPTKGTLAIFLSEKFPHEVLSSVRERYSIAGWFRVNASNSYQVNTLE